MRPCSDRHPVRGEVLGVTARAALEGGRRLARDARRAPSQDLQVAVEADDGDRSFDVGDTGRRRRHLLRIPRSRDGGEFREHLHVRRVGARQIGREGGLCAAGPGHRGHGDTPHEADEHDQREVPRPTPTEGGPETVGGLADDRSDQLRPSCSWCIVPGPATSTACDYNSSVAEQSGGTKVASVPAGPGANTHTQMPRRPGSSRSPHVV